MATTPMRRLLPLAAVACVAVAGAATVIAVQQPGQPDGPARREIPVPPIVTSLGTPPGVPDLPTRAALPDVMTLDDGTRVTTRAHWETRRQQMRRVLARYATGLMPPPPGNVTGREISAEVVLDGRVRYRLVRLTFGPERSLNLDIGIFTPTTGGPFPAVILQGGTPPGGTALSRLPQGPNQGRGENVLLLVGSAVPAQPSSTSAAPPAGGSASKDTGNRQQATGIRNPGAAPATAASLAAQRSEVFARGYALVVFNANDCAEDTTLRNMDGSWAFRTTRFFPAYPGYDWGILAGWAWGASRVADYLEQDAAIDATKLIVTGASRYGKAAMVAAAFDDRLMGAPVVTGGGGVGAYRVAGPRGSETLDLMQTKYPNWFSPHLHQFRGHRDKLPFDQHWFLALAAPRPFIALEGDTDTISLPEAVRQSMEAARPAYALLGAPDRLAVHYGRHGHAFTSGAWAAMLDFFDLHLRGTPTTRTFNRIPTEHELDAALAASRAARP